MGLLDDIRARRFRRELAKRRCGRGRPPQAAGPLNLGTAGRIVLLFPADSAEHRKTIDKWRDAHKQPTNKIEALGYFSTDVGAASFDLLAVTPKQLSWYGAPQGPTVEDFLRTSCDLLLRLGPPEHPVLDYLADLKSATLKVGPRPRATTDDNPYHLQFDTHGEEAPRAAFAAIDRIFSFTNASHPS